MSLTYLLRMSYISFSVTGGSIRSYVPSGFLRSENMSSTNRVSSMPGDHPILRQICSLMSSNVALEIPSTP